MTKTSRALKILLPKGPAWRGKRLSLLLDSIGVVLDNIRELIVNIGIESIPPLSTAMLPEWYDAYNIRYDETQDIDSLRLRLLQAFSSQGGQNILYLQRQINKLHPEASLAEIDAFTYSINGKTQTQWTYIQLLDLLKRIMPAHMHAVYNIAIINASPAAETGLALAGLAQAGRLREV